MLEALLQGRHLTEAEASDLLHTFTDPSVPSARKGALLAALRAKGETADEIRGMARAMRDAAHAVNPDRTHPLVDTCGTGGDGSDSFNISTTTALLVAACGVSVVKHGNRSVSSRCGSADVIEHLGISLAMTPEQAAAQVAATGFTFLFAPGFHPAMKAVVPVRRAMKVRTAFNLLGPLTNPARPSHQVIGAFSAKAAELMAGALQGLGATRAFVIHGARGWDEATPVGPFLQFTVTPDDVRREVVDPEAIYGLPRCTESDLAGGDVDENRAITRAVLGGEPGPRRHAVLLNAALVLRVVDPTLGPRDAVQRAAAAIDDGRAQQLLARLASAS